ncbi:hypothetical protein [Cognatishimia sp. MH4019]|uniref:hypothetical protein n=1 Tax=Cognatishimia sp. MH4019 TaxID=2854030 RepID=UPI001CD5296A|nr:hypothetical protein [Cognatishimia sp. MH4019]
MTLELQITAPVEEALRLAAWEDETTINDVLSQAIARDLHRRKELMKATYRRQMASAQ